MRVDPALVAVAVACAGIAAAATFPAGVAQAAFFTRIVDPAHPRVTDGRESGGAAWADLNGDGLPEAFVAHGNLTSQNDVLHWNLGGGAFRRVVTGPMESDGGSSIGGTWGDYDNDGRLDLFVTNRNFFGNFLYRGLGDSTFARVIAPPIASDFKNSNSSSWVDYDRDGDLDLYTVNFQAPDDFYRNEGPPGYGFAAIDTGFVLGSIEFSIPGAWCDVDDDRDPDFFVGHAGGESDYLFVQTAPGTFARTILTDARSTLGASWGDYDNDGDFDLFTASFQGHVSVLYQNAGPSGGNALVRVPDASSPFLASPGNAVGSAWGDFDNDADLDLFVARDGQDNLLFVNAGPAGGYALARVDTLGVSADGGNSFGCSWVDLDGDADLDLFVANRTLQNDFLYRNDGAAGNAIRLRLRGVHSNRAAIGARVRALATVAGVPRWQARDVEAQSGYNSQTLELHFGLGDATVVDSLVVAWPSGQIQRLAGLAANALHVIEEDPAVVGVPGRGPGTGARAVRWSVAPNPARAGAVALVAQAESPVEVELSVFDVSGRAVGDAVRESLPQGTRRVTLAMDGAPPGLYFVRLRTPSGGITTQRFILLR